MGADLSNRRQRHSKSRRNREYYYIARYEIRRLSNLLFTDCLKATATPPLALL